VKYQSLHNHTNISDGKLTHFETLDVAKKCGIDVIAFTDHDSVPNEEIVNKLKNINHSVKWIIGCEISSGLPYELGGGSSNIFHITGLFINPLDKNLINYCKLAREARVERLEKMVKNLQLLGFDIVVNDCFIDSREVVVERRQVNLAVLAKSSNWKIIKEFKNKMEKESENNPTLRKKYKQILGEGEERYFINLFLLKNSYVKNVYVDYLYYLDLDASVKLIRDAGGLALFAHWWLVKDEINYDLVEKIIKEKRMDGVEIIPLLDNLQDAILMEKLADKYDILKGGGIDAHSENDFSDFVKDKSLAEKSFNLAENIIKKARPDLTWSSF
jgi:3',5'-nucleoside bisphosphate phosphatase